jgi:uncharacterized membrane protein
LRLRILAAASLSLLVAGCAAVPEAIVEPEGETVTSEDGESVLVSVHLAQRPRGVITVRAVSTDTSEGEVSGPLVFDRSNWNVPQTITVTGVDDAELDGDVAYQVRFETSGAPPNDAPLLAEVLDFVNRDRGDGATFTAIGDLPGGASESWVNAISDYGDVIVGSSVGAQGEEAVRFTRADGLVGLGAAPSRATTVSARGTVIAGQASGGQGETGPGAFWYGDDYAIRYLVGDQRGAPPVLPPMFELTVPFVALDDGRLYGGCTQYGNPIGPIGCRQDAPGSITMLSGVSIIYDADASGNYGGVVLGNRYGNPLLPAFLNGAGLPYPADAFCITPGRCDAALRAFSQDAAIAVGTGLMSPPRLVVTEPPGELEETAWIHTTAEGISERLPDLPAGVQASGAYAISADGRVVGGFGSDTAGRRAVLWIDRAIVTVEELVSAQGGSVPEGWELSEVRALSADGHTLAGNGTNPEGVPEGFVVTLLHVP